MGFHQNEAFIWYMTVYKEYHQIQYNFLDRRIHQAMAVDLA